MELTRNMTADVQHLPPCPTEEVDQAADCYWDAAARGNGEGQSFAVIGGVFTPVGDPIPPAEAPVPTLNEHSTVTPPSTLAETGPEDFSPDVLLGGVLLVVLGITLMRRARR